MSKRAERKTYNIFAGGSLSLQRYQLPPLPDWTTTASPSWTKLPFYPPLMASVWMWGRKGAEWARGAGSEIKSLQQTVKRSVLTQSRHRAAFPQDYILKWLNSICSSFTCLPTQPHSKTTANIRQASDDSRVITFGSNFNLPTLRCGPQRPTSWQAQIRWTGLWVYGAPL